MLFVVFYLPFLANGIVFFQKDTIINSNHSYTKVDSINIQEEDASIKKNSYKPSKEEKKLRILNNNSTISLDYNQDVQNFIDYYTGPNRRLISRMLSLKEVYFSLFEAKLDKYNLPLELKYLSIVESALNPRAKSRSGAVGLWQFMYLTGQQYGLNVTSYFDERQDPHKSTEAACSYFLDLYEQFGDWNLVLAAYNGGPGYLQRVINEVGTYDFWKIQPHLRKETREYVPRFIAVNYAMNFAQDYNISSDSVYLRFTDLDTISVNLQVDTKTLSELTCIDLQTINHLNPLIKNNIFPVNAVITLPRQAIDDLSVNMKTARNFINAVENKEILINETRVVYNVKKGDYLGKIAEKHAVRVFEIKKWNNLSTTNLNIGDKLVLYVPVEKKETNNSENSTNEYIVKKGDTLWDIANNHRGVSITIIKQLNNLSDNNLIPGTKILLPRI
tara:strand:- start:2636 stop:3970 length:1335 start_codon:yes stop_codon:yes gene_type:complete